MQYYHIFWYKVQKTSHCLWFQRFSQERVWTRASSPPFIFWDSPGAWRRLMKPWISRSGQASGDQYGYSVVTKEDCKVLEKVSTLERWQSQGENTTMGSNPWGKQWWETPWLSQSGESQALPLVCSGAKQDQFISPFNPSSLLPWAGTLFREELLLWFIWQLEVAVNL